MFVNVYKSEFLQGKKRNIKIIKNVKKHTRLPTFYL